MKFAQSSIVYFHYSLEFAIRDLAALGYDAIEIWGGRPHLYRDDLDEELDALLKLLAECGMTVCNLVPAQFRYPSILCSQNERVRRSSVDYIKTAMDNAVKLHSPSTHLCGGMGLFDQDLAASRRCLRKSLEEIAEYNHDKKLRLLIEPGHRFESNLLTTVDDCLRMIDELKSPDFGILFDTGHAHLNGEKFGDVLPRCKGLPLHIHIDDNDGSGDAHRIPGEGAIDFAPLVRTLRDIGYDGFVSGELGTAYIMEPTPACRRTLAVLQGMFA